MSNQRECGCITDGEFLAKPCDKHGARSLAAPTGSDAGNHATRWLDGEISAGKLLQLAGLHGSEAHDFLGMIWQALNEKCRSLDKDLRAKMFRAERDYEKADELSGAHKDESKLAESARQRAFQESRAMLRFHLLGSIERTEAAGRDHPNE